MEPHVSDFEHVVATRGIPGIHDTVVAERTVDSLIDHLFYSRHPATFRVGIFTSLQGNVDQRAGDCIDLRFVH